MSMVVLFLQNILIDKKILSSKIMNVEKGELPEAAEIRLTPSWTHNLIWIMPT